MKLAVLTSSISRLAGGLFESVRQLHQSVAVADDIETDIFGIHDEFSAVDADRWRPLKLSICKKLGPTSLAFSPEMLSLVRKEEFDIVHVHGIWQGPSIASLRWATRTGRPHIVSPRGMLDPWAVQNSRWKKAIVAFLYENAHLRRAACLHALCDSERLAIRAYGLTNPVCVVPNGVTLPADIPSGAGSEKSNQRKKTLLFLGRVHPKKGLLNLLRAWGSEVHDRSAGLHEWQLVIAGWDDGGHLQKLQEVCDGLGLNWAAPEPENRSKVVDQPVLFYGSAFGREKDTLLRTADAFVLPSFSEGLPVAVLEAWAYGLPVLMTPQCNLPEGFAAGAAIPVEPCAESIAGGLRTLCSMADAERRAMGLQGRQLVERQFTWAQIAAQTREVYEWMLTGRSQPECVTHK